MKFLLAKLRIKRLEFTCELWQLTGQIHQHILNLTYLDPFHFCKPICYQQLRRCCVA